MSSFLERHRKKGLLAFLLLLLRRHKVLAPLLLVVVLLLFIFTPLNLLGLSLQALSRFPLGSQVASGLAWLSSRLGGRGERPFSDLLAGFKAARQDKNSGWGMFLREAGGGAGLGPSSVEMVRGNPEGPGGEGLAAKLKGEEPVKGVFDPEEAGDSEVDLSREELVAGGQGPESGFAAGAGKAWAGGSNPTLAMFGAGAYAGRGFFDGSAAAFKTDARGSALESTSVPRAGSLRVRAEEGRLSRKNLDKARTSLQAASHRVQVRPSKKAFTQLADGRARAMMARDPLCTATNNCPPEYAAVNTGAVYDGNLVGPGSGGVLATPDLGGDLLPNPNIPSDSNLQKLDQEARKMQQDAEACKRSNEKYLGSGGTPGPVTLKQQEITQLSKKMVAKDCGGGGCKSKKKAKDCKKLVDRMKQACRSLDGDMQAHYKDCPIMQQEGPYQHQDCR